ncbi:MAG: metallophosphoesterase family protein [Bacillota bacterium]|nr:metallophosphoesterase family protein [Bacillota bacterium]
MKILYFTDTHITTFKPYNRKDNYYEAVKNKFIEVIEIAEKEQVDYVFHGGDWFDRPEIDTTVINEFIKIIKLFRSPVYTVAGNHDIYIRNPDSLENTMLGVLEQNNLVRLLHSDEFVILEQDGIRLQLTGKPYQFNIDTKERKNAYIIKKRSDADYAINIVHGMLLQEPFPKGVSYTLIRDVTETEADITLSGHYHSGFGIIKVGEKYFINPGSLVRITNYKSELVRRPRVFIIELDKRIDIRQIELISALEGNDVLIREKLLF